MGDPHYPPQVTLANWQRAPFNRWAFQHVRELIPTATIARGTSQVRQLPRDERWLGSTTFTLGRHKVTVAELLASSYTDGFLVLHRGQVVAEQYFSGMTEDTPHLLMSVTKSVVGAVAGVLAGRGLLEVGAQVTEIVPELAETAFAGATVRDLLDMRAGTRFHEDSTDPASDLRAYEEIYLWRPAPAVGEPGCGVPADALSYFSTLGNDGPHGGPFRYRSILTDVLGWVLERAAGERLAGLIASEVWQPMGAEFDAEITVDAHGNALAGGGMSATLRDLARFGELFLPGHQEERRVVPGPWVQDTVAGSADGVRAFIEGGSAFDYPAGAHYRNLWWVRSPEVPFFYATGIHGQHVFVHVPSETVIVKLSAWPTPLNAWLFAQTLACVQSIIATLTK